MMDWGLDSMKEFMEQSVPYFILEKVKISLFKNIFTVSYTHQYWVGLGIQSWGPHIGSHMYKARVYIFEPYFPF